MAIFFSRLFLVLSLALFGALQSDLAKAEQNTHPVAASDIVFVQAILTAQNPILRVQLPQDDAPDFTLPEKTNPEPTDAVMFAASFKPNDSFSLITLDILPPVRGPPAV